MRRGGKHFRDRGAFAEQQCCRSVAAEAFVGRSRPSDAHVGGHCQAAGGRRSPPRRDSAAPGADEVGGERPAGSPRAAWMADAFVLSAYAGLLVAKYRLVGSDVLRGPRGRGNRHRGAVLVEGGHHAVAAPQPMSPRASRYRGK